MPVSQDGHRIRDRKNFINPVADENDGRASFPPLLDNVEEVLRVALAERRRWLVEDNNVWLVLKRPCQGDELALSEVEALELHSGMNVLKTDKVEQAGAIGIHFAPVDRSEATRILRGEKDVFA